MQKRTTVITGNGRLTFLLFQLVIFSNCLVTYAEKGVPSFWLNAMKNNDVLSEEVS